MIRRSTNLATVIAKLSIVVEEADEADFWLEFLIDENLMDRKLAEPLMIEAKELTSISIASRITAKKNKK